MGGAPKVRKRCCGHPDCYKGKGHDVDKKDERTFTPCSPQHARELIEAVYLGDPDLCDLERPEPFVATIVSPSGNQVSSATAYARTQHVLLERPCELPQDATEAVGLCNKAYKKAGFTTVNIKARASNSRRYEGSSFPSKRPQVITIMFIDCICITIG